MRGGIDIVKGTKGYYWKDGSKGFLREENHFCSLMDYFIVK